jgi:hypothetical protein
MTTERTEAPKRLRAADVIETLENTLRNVTTRRDSEPYVTVDLTRNAKGETQASTKVSAPFGCDLEALAEYAETVRLIAVTTHEATLRRFPTAAGKVTNDGEPISG